MDVYLDIHEPKELKTALERQSLSVSQRYLNIGDIQVGRWIIERKTWSDLVASYLKPTFWERWARIADYEGTEIVPILLVEGTSIEKWQALARTQNPFARRKGILGTMTSLIGKFGVHILHAEEKFETAYIVSALYKMETGEGQKGRLPLRIPKSLNIEDIKKNMLMCVPHVGERKAVEILEAAGYRLRAVPDVVDNIKRLPSQSKDILRDILS